MATANLGYLPACIVAGESIWISADNTLGSAVDIVIAGYLPATHSLAYQFSAPTAITVNAVANGGGTGWTLDVTPAMTLLWYAGDIQFTGLMTTTLTSRVTAVDAGAVSVTANPTVASQFQTVLDTIDAAIATYAANPFGSVNIGGDNSVTYRRLQDLIDLRRYYQNLVNKQTSGRVKRIIRTRFN